MDVWSVDGCAERCDGGEAGVEEGDVKGGIQLGIAC